MRFATRKLGIDDFHAPFARRGAQKQAVAVGALRLRYVIETRRRRRWLVSDCTPTPTTGCEPFNQGARKISAAESKGLTPAAVCSDDEESQASRGSNIRGSNLSIWAEKCRNRCVWVAAFSGIGCARGVR
jgi:hypothetical protein